MKISMKKWSLAFVALLLVATTASALPYKTTTFAVASPSPYSAAAANEIAAAGGNVFDQAIAVALAMAVTHPYYASLGGGGFAVLRKQNVDAKNGVTSSSFDVIDFRETAPQATSRETFVGKDPKAATDGGLASGVPGVPAGLQAIHKKYGKIAWKMLFAPALRLAEKGFPVSGEWASLTKTGFDAFNGAGKAAFGRAIHNGTVTTFEPLRAGDILKQPKLAKALKLLRDGGARAFYEGAIASDIVKTVAETGGVISRDDLKNYSAEWREPLRRSWRGYDLALMPAPSSGGVIIAQGLELLNRLEVKMGVPASLSTQEAHIWGETLKLAFAPRGLMGDPMGTDKMKNLTTALLDPARLDRLAKLIRADKALDVKALKPDVRKDVMAENVVPAANEKTETTHFSLADRDGNAVAWTTTLNGSYGSGMVTNDFGIALNDEMDDFATQPGVANQYGLVQGEANAVAPRKRPLSSMSPVIIEKNGEFVASLGAPGGPRIASAVFQAIVRTLTQNGNAEDIVSQPRVHHQFLPNVLIYDAKKFAPEILANLKGFGHELQESWIAKVYLIRKTADGYLEAAADPRGEAAAGGR